MAAGAAVESLVRGPARPRLAALLLAAGVALAAAGIAPSTAAGRRALGAAGARAVRILRERGHLRQAPEVYAARMDAYVASARLTALRRLAIPGTLLAAAGWALFRPRRRGAVFAAAAAGELLAFGCGYLPAVPERAIPAAAPFVADLRRIPGHERALLAAAPDLYPPNLGTRDAVRDARSYDVLESPAEIAALRRCGYDPATRAFPTPATPEAADCLARLGVGWFLSREPVPGRRRVGGGPPPAPGLYALDAPGAPASPPVRPWEGPSAAGIAVTGLGVAATLLAAAAARDRSPRTRGEPLL
jgi:hypothetical protein